MLAGGGRGEFRVSNGWAESDYSRAFFSVNRLGFATEADKCSVLGTAICDPKLGLSRDIQVALEQYVVEGRLPDQEEFGRALNDNNVDFHEWRRSCWRACYHCRKETFRSKNDQRRLQESLRPRPRPKWRNDPQDEEAVVEQSPRVDRELEASGNIEAKDAPDPATRHSELHAMESRERLDRCMEWISGLPKNLQDVVLVIADRLTIPQYCARHECTPSQYQDAKRMYIRMRTRFTLEEIDADGS